MRLNAALPVYRAETIGPCIAAADDDDALPLRRNRFIRQRVAGVPFVLLREKFHCEMHALEFTPGNRQLTSLFRPRGKADGIELLSQLFTRDVCSDCHSGFELDPLGFHLLQPPVDNPFLHLEIRDAVAEQATDAISLLEESVAMTGPRELLR